MQGLGGGRKKGGGRDRWPILISNGPRKEGGELIYNAGLHGMPVMYKRGGVDRHNSANWRFQNIFFRSP